MHSALRELPGGSRALWKVLVVVVLASGLGAPSLDAQRESRGKKARIPIVIDSAGSLLEGPQKHQAALSKAPGETFVLAEFDFEGGTGPDPQGWTSVDRTAQLDTFFHIDGTNGALDGGDFGRLVPLSGNQSLWCGVDAGSSGPYCTWNSLPGYGNFWRQRFEATFDSLPNGSYLSYKVAWDLEYQYDAMKVYVVYGPDSLECIETINDGSGYYDDIGELAESLSLSPYASQDPVVIRFEVTSDGAYSDEDGVYNSDGAVIIDDLKVEGSGFVNLQTFEGEAIGARSTNDGRWHATVGEGFGDFAALYPGSTVDQDDPDTTNTSYLWAFLHLNECLHYPEMLATPSDCNDTTGCLFNEIWSPPIPFTGSGDLVVLSFDVYADLPFANGTFYTWSVRSRVDGCWGTWKMTLYYSYYGRWTKRSIAIGDSIATGADSIQIALGVKVIEQYRTNPVCTQSPLFDNVRVTRGDMTPPICRVEPSAIDFGNVDVSSVTDTTFTITNAGGGVLRGSVREWCEHYSFLPPGYELTAGRSQVVTVRFLPTSAGTHNCTIETGTDLCADVSVTGTAGPICAVDPDSIAFPGFTQVGSTRDTTFTITNEGSGILAGNVSESCEHFGIVSGGGSFSLAHAQSRVVTVRFQPTDNGTHHCTIDLGASVCSDVVVSGTAWTCPPDSVLYVDADATGTGDGSSWQDAFEELRDALVYFYTCADVKQIWVAEGTYKPTAGTDRTASFELQNGMALYGGFAGDETSVNQRNLAEHTTILSGDIGVVGTATDNCYHVVKIDWIDSAWAAVLDGFTVTGGYANGSSPTERMRGGGIYVNAVGASPVIRRVTVSGNYASSRGGGMFCQSNPAVTDAVFQQNTTDASGGGMYLGLSRARLTNVRFANNEARFGGGIYNEGCNQDKYINVLFYGNHVTQNGGGLYYYNSESTTLKPELTNASFSRNWATDGGGGIGMLYRAKIVLTNSVLWGDSSGTGVCPEIEIAASGTTISYSIVQGCGGSGAGWNAGFGTDGGYNLDADPLFFHAPEGDLRLQVGSPAIDAGNNSPPGGLPATDLAGNPRIRNGVVDMGAYEGAVVNVAVTSIPPGLDVEVDGDTFVAPRAFYSEAGSNHEIGVSTPQQRGDTLYSFIGWSDEGDTTHTVTLPDTNVTYTASFARLFNYAQIDSIVDVPGDQGGWVRVYFKRSYYDNPRETQYPVARYDVHRRVDNPALVSSILTNGQIITGEVVVTFPGGEKALLAPYSPETGRWYVCYVDRYYLVMSPPEGKAPPGVWEVVGNVSATQQGQYIRLSPTLADFGATIPWSVYYVSAHTTTPSVYFDSPPDSGYSVDNIPPGVPEGFAVAYNTGSGNHLTWDPSAEGDFQYFKVYRGTSPDFVPGPENEVHATAETEWTDPDYDDGDVYYKITAVDHAGNESDPASPESTTNVGDQATPSVFALYQNVPNPFNPETAIRYDVPAGGGKVTLCLYDVSGRLVRTLVDDEESPGQKTARWDGTNDGGEHVASGIYFYRMTAPGFTETRKMVLLQ